VNIDFIRGVTAHLTAAVVVLGGLAAIVILTANGTFPADAGLPAIAAIIAGAAGFIWGAEVAKQAANQTRRDIMQEPPPAPPAP
jgi:hypothetical protein